MMSADDVIRDARLTALEYQVETLIQALESMMLMNKTLISTMALMGVETSLPH